MSHSSGVRLYRFPGQDQRYIDLHGQRAHIQPYNQTTSYLDQREKRYASNLPTNISVPVPHNYFKLGTAYYPSEGFYDPVERVNVKPEVNPHQYGRGMYDMERQRVSSLAYHGTRPPTRGADAFCTADGRIIGRDIIPQGVITRPMNPLEKRESDYASRKQSVERLLNSKTHQHGEVIRDEELRRKPNSSDVVFAGGFEQSHLSKQGAFHLPMHKKTFDTAVVAVKQLSRDFSHVQGPAIERNGTFRDTRVFGSRTQTVSNGSLRTENSNYDIYDGLQLSGNAPMLWTNKRDMSKNPNFVRGGDTFHNPKASSTFVPGMQEHLYYENSNNFKTIGKMWNTRRESKNGTKVAMSIDNSRHAIFTQTPRFTTPGRHVYRPVQHTEHSSFGSQDVNRHHVTTGRNREYDMSVVAGFAPIAELRDNRTPSTYLSSSAVTKAKIPKQVLYMRG